MPQHSMHFHWMTLEAISVEPHSDTQNQDKTKSSVDLCQFFFCAFLVKVGDAVWPRVFFGGRQVRFIVAGRFDLRILRGLHVKTVIVPNQKRASLLPLILLNLYPCHFIQRAFSCWNEIFSKRYVLPFSLYGEHPILLHVQLLTADHVKHTCRC